MLIEMDEDTYTELSATLAAAEKRESLLEAYNISLLLIEDAIRNTEALTLNEAGEICVDNIPLSAYISSIHKTKGEQTNE